MSNGKLTVLPLQLPQQRPMGKTLRTDRWWLEPVLVLGGLLAFIVYSTWAAFQGSYYELTTGGAQYLSPFYSPLIFSPPGTESHHAWFGEAPKWLMSIWPSFIPFSPALLILWAPGGFRFTCYYYRGAYYKSFWADPVACAVGEPRKSYLGENSFPLIIQNIHRYFMYLAVAFLFLLAYDAIKSYFFIGDDGRQHFGIGVGSLVLTINPILLGGYTLGCHSLRHLIGGRFDCISSSPGRKKAYDCVTCLNIAHKRWAWMSLIWVGFTDIYIRLCSMGIWHDMRIL